MAKMYQIQASLRPRLTVIGDWELFAASVGMYANGLRASIGLHNGELQLSELVQLGMPKEREALAVQIANAIGTDNIPTGTIERHLLQLSDMLDGVLLQLEEESNRRESSLKPTTPGFFCKTPSPGTYR